MKLGLQGTEIKVEDQAAEENDARRSSGRLRSKRQRNQSPGVDTAAEAAAAHATANECQAQFSRLASQHLLVSKGPSVACRVAVHTTISMDPYPPVWRHRWHCSSV